MEDTPIPIDSNGNYSLPPGYLGVPGQTILAQQHNAPLEDIAAALSQVVLRSGVSPFSGNQSMAGFKITNAADGAADGDYVNMSQLNDVIAQINAVAASIPGVAVPTGILAPFRGTTPPTGWVKENGGTIGNAASGATNRANADTEALFTHLWNSFNNTLLPIQTSGGAPTTRGASAAADYAASKRMPLFDPRSRFVRAADDGLGYDPGLTVGATQDDAIQNITGGFSSRRTNAASPEDIADWTGAFFDNGLGGSDLSLSVGGAILRRQTGFDASRVVRTSSETRGRSSIALYIIKL